MTTKWRKSPPELIEQFLAATSELPNLEARKMFGYPCCFVNGNMVTGLHQENWIIRLGEKEREAIIKEYDTSIFESTPGRPMKQYVILPKAIIDDKANLMLWLKKSLAYAESLPVKEPKPRVKRAPKKAR